MWRQALLFLALGLGLCGAVEAAPIDFHCPTPDFSMQIPDGFQVYQQGVSDETIYAFVAVGPAYKDLSIAIERLPQELPDRGGLDPKTILSQVPAGSTLQAGQLPWEDHDLDVAYVDSTQDGSSDSAVIVQMPLLHYALHLIVAGPKGDARLPALTQTLLQNLQGPSNWPTNRERFERLAVLLGCVLGVPLVWTVWRSRRS